MQESRGLEQLIYLFSKLPGLGRRSARRIVLHLLQDKDTRLGALINGLTEAYNQINKCSICNNIDYDNVCYICADETREDSVIAVVETVAELWAIERSKTFKGKYHVLGGTLSAIEDRTPDQLLLNKLKQRCINNNTQELIIATNATLDGHTTAYFIIEYFKDHKIDISRLASGIPIGGELDYLDEGTLSTALAKRTPFD